MLLLLAGFCVLGILGALPPSAKFSVSTDKKFRACQVLSQLAVALGGCIWFPGILLSRPQVSAEVSSEYVIPWLPGILRALSQYSIQVAKYPPSTKYKLPLVYLVCILGGCTWCVFLVCVLRACRWVHLVGVLWRALVAKFGVLVG